MEEDHLRVARTHTYMAVWNGLLALLFLVGFFVLLGDKTPTDSPSIILIPALIYGLFTALHIWLARGAAAQSETSRRVSKVLGYIMLVGFPIGTMIGSYLLTHTKSWEGTPFVFNAANSPDDPNLMPPTPRPAENVKDASGPTVSPPVSPPPVSKPPAQKHSTPNSRHYYVFAHNFLRDFAFHQPLNLLNILASDTYAVFFDTLLKELDTRLPPSERRNFTGADLRVFFLLIDHRPCAIVQMPPTTNPAEAFFVAIVGRRPLDELVALQESDMDAVLIDYYTLERPVEPTPAEPSVFCSWIKSGSHTNYGTGPQPTRDAFVAFLTEWVESEWMYGDDEEQAQEDEASPPSEAAKPPSLPDQEVKTSPPGLTLLMPAEGMPQEPPQNNPLRSAPILLEAGVNPSNWAQKAAEAERDDNDQLFNAIMKAYFLRPKTQEPQENPQQNTQNNPPHIPTTKRYNGPPLPPIRFFDSEEEMEHWEREEQAKRLPLLSPEREALLTQAGVTIHNFGEKAVEAMQMGNHQLAEVITGKYILPPRQDETLEQDEAITQTGKSARQQIQFLTDEEVAHYLEPHMEAELPQLSPQEEAMLTQAGVTIYNYPQKAVEASEANNEQLGMAIIAKYILPPPQDEVPEHVAEPPAEEPLAEYVNFARHIFVFYTLRCYEAMQSTLDAQAIPHGSSTIMEIACLNLFFLQEEMGDMDTEQQAILEDTLASWMGEPFAPAYGVEKVIDFINSRLKTYYETTKQQGISPEDWREGYHTWGSLIMGVWIDPLYEHIRAHRRQPDALNLAPVTVQYGDTELEVLKQRLRAKTMLGECLLQNTVFLIMAVREMLLSQHLPAMTQPELQRVWDTSIKSTWDLLLTQKQSTAAEEAEEEEDEYPQTKYPVSEEVLKVLQQAGVTQDNWSQKMASAAANDDRAVFSAIMEAYFLSPNS